MKPIQKPIMAARATTAAAGLALALALTGCGSTGTDEPEKTEEASQSEDTSDAGGMQGGAAQTEAPTEAPSEAAGSEPSESKSEDPFADAARATSWASDDSMKVNKDGDGKVPAASLEADLDDLFKNKFDMKVKKVECAKDMKVIDWWGLSTCNVTDDEKTYYGSVKLIDHKDNMIKYEVKFPGIDKSEVDF